MKKAIVLILLLTPILSNSQYLRDYKQLSFYFGQTYRLNNNFYNSFDVSYEHYASSCRSSSYNGYGVRLDNYGTHDVAIGLKYFRSIVRRPSMWLIPYYGISPVLCKSEKNLELNLKPEIGLKYISPQFSRKQVIYITLNISYGYDIPIIHETKYNIGRHDFFGRAALTFNISNFKYFYKKSNSKDEK